MLSVLILAQLVAGGGAGVHGMVREADHGPAIPGASVELDGRARTVTDSGGRYSIAGLAPGIHQFRFLALGFQIRSVSVNMADSSDLDLDIELPIGRLVLPPLDVIARATGDPVRVTDAWREGGEFRLGSGWQANQLAGEIDPDRAIAGLPGVSSRGSGSGLSIHGGSAAQNAVYLDGIPLFGAVHFGGASSGVNPDAVRTIDVHTGVHSVRYGDALAGVMEFSTRDSMSAALRWSGTLSPVDARTVARTPLGRHTALLVGVRSSFRNLFTDGAPFGATNGYRDLVATVDAPLAGGALHTLAFGSENRIRWAPYAGYDVNDDPMTSEATRNEAVWGSAATGATWTRGGGARPLWSATAWWSGTGTSLAANMSSASQTLRNGVSEFGASLARQDSSATLRTVVGGEIDRPRTWYAVISDVAPAFARYAEPIFGAIYGESTWNPAPWVGVISGLRAGSDFRSGPYLDPRLSLNVALDSVTRFTAGFGRTHQALQSMLNDENFLAVVLAPSLLVAPSAGAPLARSDQWQFGVSHVLGRATAVAINGYARNWDNVLVPAVGTSGFFLAAPPRYGSGHATGLLATVTTTRGRIMMGITAGLATAVQHTAGTSYRIGTNQPWAISGTVAWRPDLRTSFQLRWDAGAGQSSSLLASGLEWQPYQPATGSGELEGAATNLPGPVNGQRLPGALRIDLGARRTWLVGRRSINAAVQFENLLNRADPVGVVAGMGTTLQYLRGTPRGVVFELGWYY